MRFELYRSVPVVWRSAQCVQFGIDDPVLIDGLTAADTELINAVRMGIGAADFFSRAEQLGCSRTRASSLLSLLGEAGVLIPDARASSHDSRQGSVDAYAASLGREPGRVAAQLSQAHIHVLGPLRRTLCAGLLDAGLRADLIDRAEDALTARHPLVVMTGVWIEDAVSAGFLHDHGIDHCHVIVGQEHAHISHVIRAGSTPCTRCAVKFRCDEDTHWLHSWQALWRQAPHGGLIDPVLAAMAGVHAASHLREHIVTDAGEPAGRSVTAAGHIEATTPRFHPDCDCSASVPTHLSA